MGLGSTEGGQAHDVVATNSPLAFRNNQPKNILVGRREALWAPTVHTPKGISRAGCHGDN